MKANVRQYRCRAGPVVRCEGLSMYYRHAREDEYGEGARLEGRWC